VHELLALAALGFAVPQLLPQLHRVRTVGVDGVSLPWAALTVVGNAAWCTYMVRTGLWAGAVPTATSAVLGAGIVLALLRRGADGRTGLALAGGWAGVLAVAGVVGGPAALGTLLTGALALQAAPSIRTAWTTTTRSGISRATWALVAAETTCWGAVGLLDARAPLIALGITGCTAAAAMLWLTRAERPMAAADRTAARPVAS
jgi:hypothetical protein